MDVAPCLERPAAVEDWGMSDPMGKTIDGVRQVRDQVITKARELIEKMIAGSGSVASKGIDYD